MKKWMSRAALLVGSPVVAGGLLAWGAGAKESLVGRLAQVAGGCMALFWLTATFFIVCAAFSGGAGYQAADAPTPARHVETSSTRTKEDKDDAERA